jgi:hypothetical protein
MNLCEYSPSLLVSVITFWNPLTSIINILSSWLSHDDAMLLVLERYKRTTLSARFPIQHTRSLVESILSLVDQSPLSSDTFSLHSFLFTMKFRFSMCAAELLSVRCFDPS